MSSSAQGPFILVSGANRGIGLDLVKELIQRYPKTVVFAGTRDPAAAHALNELASKNVNVHVIKLVADDEDSNKKALEEVKKVTDRLDVVVANAGELLLPKTLEFLLISSSKHQLTLRPPPHQDVNFFKTVFQVNTLGPVYLYQATFPLLMATREIDPLLPEPKFFITSSLIASATACPPMFLNGSYGAAKAAVNYVAQIIHAQTEKYKGVSIPYHSGMGIDPNNMPGVISSEQSAVEFADLIVKAARAEHGGKFWGQGIPGPIPW